MRSIGKKVRLEKSAKESLGFTLIELMVAVAILAMICVLLAKLTEDTQNVTGPNLRRLDVDGQSQLAFDRLFLDFTGMPLRGDVPCLIQNTTDGSPLLRFLSTIPSSSGNRGLSVISYRMGKDTGSGAPVTSGYLCLQRASKGADWAQSLMGSKANGSPVTFADLPSTLIASDSDYDVLAEGIVRMMITCRRSDTGAMTSSFPVNTAGESDLSKVSGIVVSLVALDPRSLKLLSPTQVDAIAAMFPAPADGSLPAQSWETIARNPGTFPGYPKAVAQSFRVYQRFFPVTLSSP
jgi:prepilin-type N-terminal cleavage/methylation domain-containing protein